MFRTLPLALLIFSGCITTLPLNSLIDGAKRNEAAAVEGAVNERYEVVGQVLDISFERHSSTETNSSTVAVPVGKATIVSSKSSTDQVHYERAYADLDAGGTPVRCYFNNGGETERLSKGSTATIRGWFYSLRRNESSFRVYLEGCRVEEVSRQ